MERIIESGFIRVYNKMLDVNSAYRVTADELYIYSILFINRRQGESLFTSIGMIESTMLDEARLSNREQTQKKKIIEALKGLLEKKILLMVSDIDIEDVKTHTFFTMKINDWELVADPSKDTFNGYEQFYMHNYRMLMTSYEMLIYINSQRFSGDGGFRGSYERWAKLLNVSRNTAVKLLEQARKRGIISIVRGEYIAKNRQEINNYFSVDFIDYEDEQQEEDSKPSENKNNVIAFDGTNNNNDIKKDVGNRLPF